MEEDTEVLDWGHDDDEQATQRSSGDGRDDWRDPEDAEDAVSLGGDEDDMQDFYAYQSTEQDASKGQAPTQKSSSGSQQHPQQSRRDHQREPSSNSQTQKQSATQPQDTESPQLRRSQSLGKLTHALPPKPVVSIVEFVHPSPAQMSTLASSMVQRERRSNGHGKPGSSGNGGDTLPPDWEIRYPRGGGEEHYYYNVKTHESTWSQPGSVSGRSSPSKDRENGSVRSRDGRSPGRNGSNVKARAASSERRATSHSSRKDLKRKVSPVGGLSYEDRHYRPGGLANAAASVDERGSTTQSPFPEAPYAAARPPSPRMLSERRRSRSLTPPQPRREHEMQDRSARSRRELTPPRSPVDNDLWRTSQLDGALRSRPANAPDRRWGSSRTPVAIEPAPGQNRDEHNRGRLQRGDFELSQRISLSKDQSVRHDTVEWPALRNRSPPPRVREVSPPNARRFPQGPASGNLQLPAAVNLPVVPRQKSRFDRPASPPLPPSALGPSRNFGDYPPPESVPQRRGRDVEAADVGPETEVKRRRVDSRASDLGPRRPAETIPTSNLPERPHPVLFSHPAPENDQFRRSLPQGVHTTTPAVESLPFPPPPAEPNRGGYDDRPPRPFHDDGALPRFTNASSDVPSAPRRQIAAPSVHDADFHERALAPPARPVVTSGRSGSRFDKPLPAQARNHPVHLDRDAMDVDHAPHTMSSLRINDGPPRVHTGMYADRLGVDSQVDALPRGPRAMASRGSSHAPYTPPAASPLISPSTSNMNLRSMQPPDFMPPPGRPRERVSQSQPSNDAWGERRDWQDTLSTFPKNATAPPGSQPRRFDDARNVPYDGPPDRHNRGTEDVYEPKHQDIRQEREPPTRYPYRSADGPPTPPLPLSSTNSVPIGNRKAASIIQPLAPHSPVDRVRLAAGNFGDASRGRPPHGRPEMQDDYDRTVPQYSGPLASINMHYPVMAENGMPVRRSVPNRNEGMMPERPPTQAPGEHQAGTPTSRPRKDSYQERRELGEHGARPSRFGPEQPVSGPPEPEPRLWLTREESRSMEILKREPYQTGDVYNPLESRPLRSDTNSRHPPEANDLSQISKGTSRDRAPRQRDTAPRSAVGDDAALPRRQPFVSPEHGRERSSSRDSRPRAGPPSLEFRLSSHSDKPFEQRYRPLETLPPSLPARPPDSYSQPHPDYRENRNQLKFRDGEPAIWDRRREPQAFREPSPPGGRVHPDRARLLQPPSTSVSNAEQDLMRTSKPVRIRRPPPSSAKPQQEDFPPSVGRDDHRSGDDFHSPQSAARPGIARRGGSLLDRLSLDNPTSLTAEAPSPSLRDRVENYSKNAGKEFGGADADTAMDVDHDGGGFPGDSGVRGMRGGKKRNKRGRRGAPQ